MEFSRQEYWSGWPFPPPGDLPDPGIEPRSPASQADSVPSELPGKPKWKHSALGNTWELGVNPESATAMELQRSLLSSKALASIRM